jgi:UDP-glucose 4-epimerase
MAGIVITGASGLLGRAVTARLTALGLPYVAVSRRSEPGYHQVVDYKNTPAGDVLIHLAEEPDRAIVNSLSETYLDHAAALVHTLAKRAGTLVYASSGVVYGDMSDAPFSPHAAVVPTDLYSRSKVQNEALVLAAGGTVLRLSNLFGPGMSSNNVISDIARQLVSNDALQVRDDMPVRDFLSASAAAEAIVMLLQTPCPGILNLGSGIGLSIRELALLALHSVGQQGREIVVSQATARRSVNILNIAETQRRLGWSPGPSPVLALRDFFSKRVNLDN